MRKAMMRRRSLSKMMLLSLMLLGPLSSSILLTGVAPDQFGLVPANAATVEASTTARVGGLVRVVDPVHKVFVIFSPTKSRRFTIDVSPSTRMTLGRWTAGFTDVQVGDHLTVTGASSLGATTTILARTIRIGSPAFAGRVIAVTPGAGGVVMLRVLANHRHVLTVAVQPTTSVLYGSDKGVVGDLTVGERIVAHGVRQNKYLLAATTVRVYPHTHTIGGTVTVATAGVPLVYTLLSPNGGGVHTVRTTARTVYALGGHTVAAALVRVGTHIRVRGYDLLGSPNAKTPTLIAIRITILIQHHTTKKPKPTPTAHASRPAGQGSQPPATHQQVWSGPAIVVGLGATEKARG